MILSPQPRYYSASYGGHTVHYLPVVGDTPETIARALAERFRPWRREFVVRAVGDKIEILTPCEPVAR